MKNIFLIFAFAFRIAYSQTDSDCKLDSYMSIYPKQDIVIEVLEAEIFWQAEKTNESIFHYTSIQNSDSLEMILLKNYDFIEKSNDTLRFNCKNKLFQVCNRTIDDSKGNRRYKLMGFYGDSYLLIRDLAYEYIGAILIDLDNRIGYLLPTKPIVQTGNYIYSGADEYGDFGISVYGKNGELVIGLGFNSAQIDSYFIRNDYLYFKVKSACGKWGLKEFHRVKLPTTSGHKTVRG